MPYPNEHAARLKSPSKYERFARTKPKGFPAGVSVIWGIRKNPQGKNVTEMQAIRFDRKKWTAEKAKAWLASHDMKPILFEPASTPTKKDVSVEKGFWSGVL